MKACIPERKSEIYHKKYFLRNIRLKTIDNDCNWTIQGMLLRSPGKIKGTALKITNPNTKFLKETKLFSLFRKNPDLPKYPAITFSKIEETISYQYNDDNHISSIVATITPPDSKFSLTNTFWYMIGRRPCDPNIIEQDKLKMAVNNNDFSQVKALVGSKVNIDGRGNANSLCAIYQAVYDRTPLMIAAAKNYLDILRLLLRSGAHFDLEDCWGNTALDLAITYKSTQAAEILYSCQARQHTTKPEEYVELTSKTPMPIA